MSDADNDKTAMKLVFAPGSFDDFDGTQAELDELITEITRQVTSGEIFDHSEPMDDAGWDELPDHVKQALMEEFEEYEGSVPTHRVLH